MAVKNTRITITTNTCNLAVKLFLKGLIFSCRMDQLLPPLPLYVKIPDQCDDFYLSQSDRRRGISLGILNFTFKSNEIVSLAVGQIRG